jgi:hypothetical protein
VLPVLGLPISALVGEIRWMKQRLDERGIVVAANESGRRALPCVTRFSGIVRIVLGEGLLPEHWGLSRISKDGPRSMSHEFDGVLTTFD